MRKRIVCIVKKPTHHDRHHHITEIGVGHEPDKAVERLPVEEVIRQLKKSAGDRFFVIGTHGSESEVIYRDCPVCGPPHQIITTSPDHTKTDNLLNLRDCSKDECRIGGSGGIHFPPPPITPPGPPQPPRPPRDRGVGAF